MEMILCSECQCEMPKLRYTRFGYKRCVNCSNVDAVGGVAVTNHKTGNTIQIVSRETAIKMYNLSRRKGYGIMSGIKMN